MSCYTEATCHLVAPPHYCRPPAVSPLIHTAREHLALKETNKRATGRRGVSKRKGVGECVKDRWMASREIVVHRRRKDRQAGVLGGCHNCKTGTLQMTSFTKSYFTRGYKGHITFRTLHPPAGTAAALWALILLPNQENGHLLTMCLLLQRVIENSTGTDMK